MSDATCLILTKVRYRLLIECLSSVVNQTRPFTEIVILDSSGDTLSDEMLSAKMLFLDYINSCPAPNIRLILNPGCGSYYQNLKAGLNNVRSEYVTILHDDDLLSERYLESMTAEKVWTDEFVAVGCSAETFDDDSKRFGKFGLLPLNVTFKHPKWLIAWYLLGCISRPPPFDSYMYKTDALRQLDWISFEKSKYSDLLFLASLTSFGFIKSLRTRQILYRFHSGQDSAKRDKIEFFKLLALLKRHKFISDGIARLLALRFVRRRQ